MISNILLETEIKWKQFIIESRKTIHLAFCSNGWRGLGLGRGGGGGAGGGAPFRKISDEQVYTSRRIIQNIKQGMEKVNMIISFCLLVSSRREEHRKGCKYTKTQPP